MKLKGKQPGKVVKAENTLWAGITEDDFLYENGIENREIGEYDKECMTLCQHEPLPSAHSSVR